MRTRPAGPAPGGSSWPAAVVAGGVARAQQADQQQPHHGHHGYRRVTQRVLEHNRAPGQASGAQHHNELSRHHLRHRVTGLLGDERHGARGQGENRQRDAAQPGTRPGAERHVPGRGEHLDLDREQFDQHQGEPEVRERQAGQGHDIDQPAERPAPQRADDAQAHSGHAGDDHRREDERQAGRQAGVELLGHRLAAEQVGAEAAVQHAVQPVPVLHGQRLVKTQGAAHLLVLLRRIAAALAAQDGLRRVPRRHRGQDEGQGSDQEQQDHGRGQPPRYVPEHRRPAPAQAAGRTSYSSSNGARAEVAVLVTVLVA